MSNVAVVIVPRRMEAVLDAFFNGVVERCATEHRVYGIVHAIDGPVADKEFTFNGELMTAVKGFPTLDAAKAWVEEDAAQTHFVVQGGVS